MRMGRAGLRMLGIGLAAAGMIASVGVAAAAGTGFTYQGSLSDSGAPANGVYDLRFSLHSAASGGSPMAFADVGDVQVVNGLFSVKVDFGPGYLNGSGRWIEVGVRPGVQTGAYTALNPRQEVTPAPYAVGLSLPYSGNESSPSSLVHLTSARSARGTARRRSRIATASTRTTSAPAFSTRATPRGWITRCSTTTPAR